MKYYLSNVNKIGQELIVAQEPRELNTGRYKIVTPFELKTLEGQYGIFVTKSLKKCKSLIQSLYAATGLTFQVQEYTGLHNITGGHVK